jgi:hypothetical protein
MVSSNDVKPETKPAAATPRPATDTKLTDALSKPQDKTAEMPAEVPDKVESAPVPDFESTMIIAPDASLSSKPSGNSNSTEAFIERVKEQLSASPAEKEEEPFTSTIPQ